MVNRQGSPKKNSGNSQHRCSASNGSPLRSTNEKVGQTNLKCEHGTPTNTSL